jgi:hypothetical protein
LLFVAVGFVENECKFSLRVLLQLFSKSRKVMDEAPSLYPFALQRSLAVEWLPSNNTRRRNIGPRSITSLLNVVELYFVFFI